MGGYYIFVGYNLEKHGKFWENGRFSGRIWPDWGNTAWADMAGLGSIESKFCHTSLINFGSFFSLPEIFRVYSLHIHCPHFDHALRSTILLK